MERLPTWQIAIRRLGMPLSEYALKVVLPATVIGLLVGAFIFIIASGLFTGASGLLLALIFPLLTGGASAVWPLIQTQRQAISIEREMHMFITRMGILSLGDAGAQSMFDILKQMGDYGALAEEVQSIETLVDRWHTNLPEAARIVGRQSPSPIWGDFLDRMAFSVEAGQPLEEFMRSEQDTFQEEFNTLYDTRLEAVDTLREIYISLTTTGMFLLVVSGIHLVLFMTGTLEDDPWTVMVRIRWILLAALIYTLLQVFGLISFMVLIPDDDLFSRNDMATNYKIKMRRAWVLATSIGVVIILITLFSSILVDFSVILENWDKYGLLSIAIIVTPFAFPAHLVGREERAVRRRDESYPGFIRALGGTAQARSSEPSATVRALKGIDFGALNESIDQLERRLSMRIDSDHSWVWFAADANSMMVSRFIRIYLEGAQTSGEPAGVAELVSKNTTNLLSLRRRRALSSGTMQGVAFGVLVAMITSLNITISIVQGLGSSISGVAQGLVQTDVAGIPQMAGGFGLPVLDDSTVVEENIFLFKIIVSVLVLMMIIILGLISSRIRGGGIALSIGQMISMLWVAGLTSLLTAILLDASIGLFITGS
ncbi:MAG: type II secretion system F family protein [Candidatus Thermoplasmatota archaeon]|nr:type II secretion system F family protein [Candidatus Thermoplasmatota archaeon]